MARVEILTLDSSVIPPVKQPAEYFAEWRASVERGRRRREALGLDPFAADRRLVAARRHRRSPGRGTPTAPSGHRLAKSA